MTEFSPTRLNKPPTFFSPIRYRKILKILYLFFSLISVLSFFQIHCSIDRNNYSRKVLVIKGRINKCCFYELRIRSLFTKTSRLCKIYVPATLNQKLNLNLKLSKCFTKKTHKKKTIELLHGFQIIQKQ